MNIGRSKRKKTERGNHRIWPSRAEIFGWLIRNEMNKTDIDGVKTKVLIQHYQMLDGPKRSPSGPPTLMGPKKSTLFILIWRNFKSWKAKNYNEKPDQQSFGIAVGQLIKFDKRTRVPWLEPSLGTQCLLCKNG